MKNKGIVTTLYAWNDQLLSLFASIVVAVALLLAIEHKQSEDGDKGAKGGNMSVYIEWPYDHDVDVDLWFSYPNCKECPNFYANLKTPKGWIGRDDTGIVNSKQNNENAALYDLEAGEYIFNLHAYGEKSQHFPTTVHVEIKYTDKAGFSKQVVNGNFTLTKVGEEITVVRFTLDDQQRVIQQHRVFKSLVSEKKSAGTGFGSGMFGQ